MSKKEVEEVKEASKEEVGIKVEILCDIMSTNGFYKKGDIVKLEQKDLDTFAESFYKVL